MERGTLGTEDVERYLGIGFVAHVHSLGQVRHHDRHLEPSLQVSREVTSCRATEEFATHTGIDQRLLISLISAVTTTQG
jgi:hypothetical protein